MAAYATADDMIARYDSRSIGNLVTDDGQRAEEVELSTNEKVTTSLSSATGRVNAACLRGNRYTVDELAGLTGDDAEYLKDIVCAQAFLILWRRRPHGDDQLRDAVKEEVDEALKQLRTGEMVFNITAVKDAGIPQIDTIARVTIGSQWELVADKCRPSFYPRRRSYRNR